MATQQPAFVFLIRHAARRVAWDVAESDHAMEGWRDLPGDVGNAYDSVAANRKGLPKTLSLASAPCDQLALMGCTALSILQSEHRVATQTAEMHQVALQRRFGAEASVKPLPTLTPAARDPERNDAAQADAAIQAIRAALTDVSKAGGQPGRDCVWPSARCCTHCTRVVKPGRLPAGVLPIGNSEIACVRLGERPALLWCLMEHTPDLAAELKAKIASKAEAPLAEWHGHRIWI